MQKTIAHLGDALGHLETVREIIFDQKMTVRTIAAQFLTHDAISKVQEARKLLDEQREESEEHDTERAGHLATTCEL